MKKTLMSLLVLLMLCATASAQSLTELDLEEVTLGLDELEYAGDWWSFEALNLQLYLPSDWVEDTENYAGGADHEFAFTPKDMSAYFNIRVFMDEDEADYQTRFEEMYAEVYESEAASGVQPVLLNEVPMITYVIGEDTGMGAVVLTDDAYLMFETVPYTEEHASLFLQILSTFALE